MIPIKKNLEHHQIAEATTTVVSITMHSDRKINAWKRKISLFSLHATGITTEDIESL